MLNNYLDGYDMMTKYLKENKFEIPQLSEEEQKEYRAEMSKNTSFKFFVLRESFYHLFSVLWKDVYRILSFKRFRIFVRNQWHCFSSESDFDVFKFGSRRQNGNFQIHLSLFGFKFVLFINGS